MDLGLESVTTLSTKTRRLVEAFVGSERPGACRRGAMATPELEGVATATSEVAAAAWLGRPAGAAVKHRLVGLVRGGRRRRPGTRPRDGG